MAPSPRSAISRSFNPLRISRRADNRSAAFGKPVLLVYGDSHVFGQSRPFPEGAPNLLALEVPGEERMNAVEVTIDPATSGVFSVTEIMNPALAKKE